MKCSVIAITCLFAAGLLAGCAAQMAATNPETGALQYSVKVREFDGCECNPVCPCIFSSDTTFGDCRGITVYTFDGTYGSTLLKNVSCAVVFTRVGKNMETTMGTWKGILYTSDKGTPSEREAIKGLLHVMMDDAFETLEPRTAPIRITREGDIRDLSLGTVGRLRIHGSKGQNGEQTKILNAPSPLAFPIMFCAVADENSYHDGEAEWAFTGRNAFFAEFDLSNVE